MRIQKALRLGVWTALLVLVALTGFAVSEILPGNGPATSPRSVSAGERLSPAAVPNPMATPLPSTATPEPTATPAPTATPVPEPDLDELQRLLDDLLAESNETNPEVEVALSVSWQGETRSANAGLVVNSASLAKVYWTVAAMDAADPDRFAEIDAIANDVLAESDNEAAGAMIDFVGVDAINFFTRGHGLASTYLASWPYGEGRAASDRGTFGSWNVTTAEDAARFADKLLHEELLSAEATAAVLEWMTATADSMESEKVWDGVLPDSLPPDVAATVAHKSGWVPPQCCGDNVIPTLNEIGVIPLPDGSAFGIALVAIGGGHEHFDHYTGAAKWMATATCRLWLWFQDQVIPLDDQIPWICWGG